MIFSCSCAEGEHAGHLLIVSFAQEEEQPPRLHCGQDKRRDPDEGGEAAAGLGTPLLHDEALLGHGDVLVLPHPAREQQAPAPEVLRVLRQRHHGDEAEHEGEEVQDALGEDQIVKGHFPVRRLVVSLRPGETAAAQQRQRRAEAQHPRARGAAED